MKNITLLILLFIASSSLNAQIAIGKDTIDGDGILDFAENAGGILLPILEKEPIQVAPGTFYVDAIEKTVKVFTGSNWENLTTEGDYTFEENRLREIGEGVVLGNDTSEASGVLVLEAENKALILPKVYDPVNTLKSPQIGTICYDTKSDTISVFDGKFWHFWK